MRALLFSASVALACSSSPPPVGPTSGVDPGDPSSPRHLSDLTPSEQQKLCDWTAASGGGYSTSTTCDGGLVVSNFSDPQACVYEFLGNCSTVTVTDWEQCRDKVVSDPCALYLYTASECMSVARCLGKTDGGP